MDRPNGSVIGEVVNPPREFGNDPVITRLARYPVRYDGRGIPDNLGINRRLYNESVGWTDQRPGGGGKGEPPSAGAAAAAAAFGFLGLGGAALRPFGAGAAG